MGRCDRCENLRGIHHIVLMPEGPMEVVLCFDCWTSVQEYYKKSGGPKEGQTVSRSVEDKIFEMTEGHSHFLVPHMLD